MPGVETGREYSMNHRALKFDRNADLDFFNTLRDRVNNYFKDNNISKHGGPKMVIKTISMYVMYLTPLVLLYTQATHNPWLNLLFWAVAGIGLAGIGLSIMHDACHGAYSKNRRWNKVLGMSLNIVGGYDKLWMLQHNVLHHSYTNVHGADEDIDAPPMLRFSPHAELKKMHRYQYIYAWFFYGLITLSWILMKDYIQVIRYKKKGLVSEKEFPAMYAKMLAWKAFYFAYALVLPLLILPYSTGFIIAGFLTMHFVGGMILSLIFQPAHVVPSSEFPLPDSTGKVDSNWAVHQMMTTMNFSPKSKWFSWYVGGLNYQVEHHLFHNISHVHYPAISKIVQATAEEFGVPYYTEKTFFGAIVKHGQMLRDLGRKDLSEKYVKAAKMSEVKAEPVPVHA